MRTDPSRGSSGPEVPYNLRFPGQYYQTETGLNQNWQRDYDALGGGRYIEPDPIGQLFYFKLTTLPFGRTMLPPATRMGYWNELYGYVDENPVALSDSTGQDALWEFVAKVLGQKAASAMQGAGVSGLLAAGCIADNCRRKVTSQSHIEAYGDCIHVLGTLKQLAGLAQTFGDIDAFLESCATTCSETLAKL